MVPLQVCTGKDGTAHLLDFEFIKAITCTYADAAGLLAVGLIVFGGINLSILIRTGDIRIPIVLTLLFGSVVLPFVASPAVTVIGVTLLIAGAGGLTLLYYRYSR